MLRTSLKSLNGQEFKIEAVYNPYRRAFLPNPNKPGKVMPVVFVKDEDGKFAKKEWVDGEMKLTPLKGMTITVIKEKDEAGQPVFGTQTIEGDYPTKEFYKTYAKCYDMKVSTAEDVLVVAYSKEEKAQVEQAGREFLLEAVSTSQIKKIIDSVELVEVIPTNDKGYEVSDWEEEHISNLKEEFVKLNVVKVPNGNPDYRFRKGKGFSTDLTANDLDDVF